MSNEQNRERGLQQEVFAGVARSLMTPQMLMVLGAIAALATSLSISNTIGDADYAVGDGDSHSHWTPAAPHGGTHEVSDNDYYGDCPPSPTGHHTWVRRFNHNPRDEYGNSVYSTEWQVCVNCGAYFN